MTGWHRTPTRPDRGPFLASVALHLALAVLVWVVHRATFAPLEFVAYEISIVSVADANLPEVIDLPAPDDLIVETPTPDLPAPEPEPTPPPPEPRPDPTPPPPEPRRDPPPDPPRQDPPRTDPPATPPPATTTGGEANVDLAVRMEGLQRDFPAYYGRILAAMEVCWRQPPGVERVSSTVRFEIERDGSIRARTITHFRRSGHGVFDLRAIQAVECAGENQRIPPLPDEIPGDRLPIELTFTASGFRE
jgi:hypothetical protein